MPAGQRGRKYAKRTKGIKRLEPALGAAEIILREAVVRKAVHGSEQSLCAMHRKGV